MSLPRCTPKQLIWILIIISVSGILHIWYITQAVDFVSDVRRYLYYARNRFLDDFADFPTPHTKHVLFWNGYGKLLDRDIQCFQPADSCVYRLRVNRSHSDDMFVYAIIFDVQNFNLKDKPKIRWRDQVYIYWCTEPSLNAPECRIQNDSFYNWTFTYHLDSNVVWRPFVVQDRNTSKMVAPNKSVIWRENHDAIKPLIKKIIGKKTKPIAWITPDCKMNHKGSSYMYELQEQLTRLGLNIDVYGPCSAHKCTDGDCLKMIRTDYYFCIAFEHYITEDYVSDRVLQAYDNYVVPIVYGGANYSWFLPPGSYLNALEMQPYSLAYAAKQAVNNATIYEGYFKWTNTYKISAYPGHHPLCNLCAALNADEKTIRKS